MQYISFLYDILMRYDGTASEGYSKCNIHFFFHMYRHTIKMYSIWKKAEDKKRIHWKICIFEKVYDRARQDDWWGGVMLAMNTEIIREIKGTAAPLCLKRYSAICIYIHVRGCISQYPICHRSQYGFYVERK